MVGNGKAVQLSHQADGGPVAAVFQIALHSGDGQALLGPQAKAFHNTGKLSGGAVLLKSQCRCMKFLKVLFFRWNPSRAKSLCCNTAIP